MTDVLEAAGFLLLIAGVLILLGGGWALLAAGGGLVAWAELSGWLDARLGDRK